MARDESCGFCHASLTHFPFLSFGHETLSVIDKDKDINYRLSPTQFKLFEYFWKEKTSLCSLETLMDTLYPIDTVDDPPYPNVIKQHNYNINQKVSPSNIKISNIRGFGYLLHHAQTKPGTIAAKSAECLACSQSISTTHPLTYKPDA